LHLAHTQVDDTGLQEIAELRDLETLVVVGSPLTDAGLRNLRKLTKLKLLIVRGSFVTPAGVDELRRALPNLRVAFD